MCADDDLASFDWLGKPEDVASSDGKETRRATVATRPSKPTANWMTGFGGPTVRDYMDPLWSPPHRES